MVFFSSNKDILNYKCGHISLSVHLFLFCAQIKMMKKEEVSRKDMTKV